jgi:hypothetical protein
MGNVYFYFLRSLTVFASLVTLCLFCFNPSKRIAFLSNSFTLNSFHLVWFSVWSSGLTLLHDTYDLFLLFEINVWYTSTTSINWVLYPV